MATVEQIRAARALLGWSQGELADRAGLSQTGIARIESGAHQPTGQTLTKILRAFQKAYVEFIPDGVRKISDIVTVRDGADCYMDILDEAIEALAPHGGEILFWGADERRSTAPVIDKTRLMRRAGIGMRFLIRDGDDYFMGRAEEYRWLGQDLFIDSDVKIMFANTISYFVSWRGGLKIITIRDEHIANENRKIFNHFWNGAQGPRRSSASVFYEQDK